jgi:hypothetical protein
LIIYTLKKKKKKKKKAIKFDLGASPNLQGTDTTQLGHVQK